MDILELLETVNRMLGEGYSTAKIEQNMGYGKDTIRKKLNRAGYKYSKEHNKYIEKDEENQGLQVDKTYKGTLNNTKSYEKEVPRVICSNTTGYTKEENKSNVAEIFTEEDLSILQTIINQYKATQRVIEQEPEDDEVMIRSVRVYKKQYESFAQFCKDNNINQAKALNTAIKGFIEQYT